MNTLSLLLLTSSETDLQEIKTLLEQLVAEGETGFLTGDFYFCAFFSMLISLLTVYAIFNEFKKTRIDETSQINLLRDLVRHLYRNKICTMTMRAKYYSMRKEGKQCYPSEEHIKKLQLLPDDIHLERYNRQGDIYDKLHELELQLRNYNAEIEVAEYHIVNPNIDEVTKHRDFETLDLKTGMLTNSIKNVLFLIRQRDGFCGSMCSWFYKKILRRPRFSMLTIVEDISSVIQKSHEGNKDRNSRELCAWGDEYADELALLRKDETTRDKYFTDVFMTGVKSKEMHDKEKSFVRSFSDAYTEDLLIECGKNRYGEERIHIIEIKEK